MNNQETTPEKTTFSEAARQAYTQRADQLEREIVSKHEETFDAQRAKLRFALENTFGEDLPISSGEAEIQFDITPDEESGEYSPAIQIDSITFVAKRFPSGALLAVETKCPQSGEIVQTPVKNMADVGQVLSNPPLSRVAKASPLLTHEQVLSRAASALYNAPPGDYLAPIMYMQAVSTREMSYKMERIERSLAHIGGNLVDINQAVSDQVYGAPEDEDSAEFLLRPEIQNQWQIGIKEHKEGSLVASLYSNKDSLNSVHFYFSLDGRQLLYSDDERAPQWVFDSVCEHLKVN